MTEKPRAVDPETTGSTPGGSTRGGPEPDGSTERVIIHDRRRIDPGGGRRHAAEPDDDAERVAPARTGGNHRSPDDDRPEEDPSDPGGEPELASAGPAESAVDGQSVTSAVDDLPAAPVVDDPELAEVLDAETPGTEPPVVDAPTSLVGGPPEAPEIPEAAEVPEDLEVASGASGAFGAELQALRAELDERTLDLQRVSAEYANYRKRVDRDRGIAAEQTTGQVLAALLPVLDDLDRAREHGDLVGPFGSVAEQLSAAMSRFGLTAFGEKGDPFDPTRHEAVAHLTSADVAESTCVEVMRRGYQLGDRLLRPALVAVADPQ